MLYGATLPPTLSLGLAIDPQKLKNIQSNPSIQEKKERYHYDDDDTSAYGSQIDLGYNTDNAYTDYIKLLAKQQLLKNLEKDVASTKSSYKFIGYSGDFKPITQTNDPETYSYYKHLENLEKHQSINFPEDSVAGFKPYSFAGSNPENSDAYKSIQDILDAHEVAKAKKRPISQNGKDRYKYVTYGNTRGKKPTVRLTSGNEHGKSSRCVPGNSGSCRKRSPIPARVRARPIVKKIRHTIVSDD